MRRLLFLISLLTGFSCLAQQQDSIYLFCYFKGNGDGLHYAYSDDGLKWKAMFSDSIVLKPTVSKDRLFRDPCIVRGGDGKFHMVWTVSWADRGIGYASSTDLVNWSPQRFIPVMTHEDSARNTWAPEINWDKKKKRYIVYWATTIAGRFAQNDTSAEGKRYNHRMYYSSTKNFKSWSRAKILYDPGYSVIDASIVKNGNEYLMFLKNETRAPAEKNIRIARSSSITGPYSEASAPITGKYWAEGPTALLVKGEWIVYFDKYRDHQYGAVRSADGKTWTDISKEVEFPKGIRHGTAFVIGRAEWEAMQQAWLKK